MNLKAMKCEICRENDVEFKSRVIINGKLKELFICKACLKKHKIQAITKPKYSDYLRLLVSEIANKRKKLRCKKCHTLYIELANKGKAGCPFCYLYFSDILEKVFRIKPIPDYKKSIEEITKNINKNDLDDVLKKADIYLSFDDIEMAKRYIEEYKKAKDDTKD